MIQPPIGTLSRLVYIIPDEQGKIEQEYLIDGTGRELEAGEALKVLNEFANKEFKLLSELKHILFKVHGHERGWTAERLRELVEREMKETPQGIVNYIKEHAIKSDDKEGHTLDNKVYLPPNWLDGLEEIFEHVGEGKLCWFVHNGEVYEMTLDDYKIIYDILRKSREDDHE